jgi:hypothetical protein
MKVKALHSVPNTGVLFPSGGTFSEIIGHTTTTRRTEFDWIEIKKGRYIHKGISHPLRSGEDKFYKRIYGLEHERRSVYWFDTFAKYSTLHGHHVSFNWIEHQQFLWLQGEQWLQKESNIRYVVNVIFLVLGSYIGFKQIGNSVSEKNSSSSRQSQTIKKSTNKKVSLESNRTKIDSNIIKMK